MARFDALVETFGAGIPYDDACVRAYGRLLATAVERGGDPKAHRLHRMIAATALAHRLTLVTRDRGDFQMFEDIIEIEVR